LSQVDAAKNEDERLRALRETTILDTAPEAGYDALARLASLIFQAPVALVSFVLEDRDYVKSCVGASARELPRRIPFCQEVVRAGELLVVSAGADGVRLGGRPVVFYAGAPLLTSEGHALGTLCVLDHVPRTPAPHQLYALEVLAGQVMAQVRLRRNSADLMAANDILKNLAEAAVAGEGRLRQVAERLSKIFAASPVAIAMLSPAEKRFIEVNERFCALTGYRPEDLLHRRSREVGLWRTARPEGSFETLLDRGSRRDVEIEIDTAQGERRAALASFDLLDLGADSCQLVMLQDLTARKELERIKDDFVAVVSHELRTPLTAIHGAIALLAQRYPSSAPEGQELLRIAVNNSERLSRLVNDILDIERIEAGKDELLLETVEAASLVDEVCQGLSGLAAERRIALQPRTEGAGQVRADRERLVQVLTNLVGNAIKFSPGEASVEVVARPLPGGGVHFSVTDHGPGIAAELQERIFEKFERLPEGRSKAGTGLGLAIAKAIVERHYGRIGLVSSPGHGASFWFEIGARP
jgi:PAS domain S-box-containing protein